MDERFLYFVWQFQKFNHRNLQTTGGERLVVFHPGFSNADAGPDFTESRIKIGDIDWHGDTEIHINASDWNNHAHNKDQNYDKVILHVVWKADREVLRPDGTPLPTLELKDLVDLNLLHKYKKLINNPNRIPCEKQFSTVPQIKVLDMLDKALMQRLERKAVEIYRMLKQNNNDWEVTSFQILCKNFGFKVNQDQFLRLGQSIPLRKLLLQAGQLRQVEAILFGQAGFLQKQKSEDRYYNELQKEYHFLQHKFHLNPVVDEHAWNFLRLRPANFPTIRIAQMAGLLAKYPHLFSLFTELENPRPFIKSLNVIQSEYWRIHYRFGKSASRRLAGLGKSSVENIIINTVTPILVAYGKQVQDQAMIDKGVDLLNYVTAENNKITRIWKDIGLPVKNAFDSQATNELYNQFCQKKRCLSCSVGLEILEYESTA